MNAAAILTLREAAGRTGRSTAFVRALIADGLIDAQVTRRRWYVSRVSLDRWCACGRPDPDPQPIVLPPMRWRRDAA